MNHKAIAKKIMDDWDKLSSKHSSFGAADSEPDWHFQNCIRLALNGKRAIPKSARDWELFPNNGVGVVLKEIVDFTDAAVNQILQTPIIDLPKLRTAFKDRLWRTGVE